MYGNIPESGQISKTYFKVWEFVCGIFLAYLKLQTSDRDPLDEVGRQEVRKSALIRDAVLPNLDQKSTERKKKLANQQTQMFTIKKN